MVALLAACDSNNNRSPGGGTQPPSWVVGKPAFVDQDADGTVSAGDTVTVRFDRPVSVRRATPIPFETPVAGDGFGTDPRIEQGDRADEVRIVLGAGARLRARGAFAGDGAGGPSGLALRQDDAIADGNGETARPDAPRDVGPGFLVDELPLPGDTVASGDIDGDGDLDLVVGLDGGAATVLTNDGDAQFTVGQQFGEGRAVALGDFDGDGDLDAVLGSNDVPSSIWRNDGGTFVSAQGLGSASTVAVCTGDVDRDGDVDVVCGNGPADPDTLWLNDGSGTFGGGIPIGDGNTHEVCFADVDRDGDLDLLQGRSGPSRIWLNDGNGGFASGPSIGSGNTRSIAAGDFDGDGDVDIVTAGRDPAELWRGDGVGGFTSTGKLANAATDAVCLVDYDGDGRLDVYAANANGQDDELWLADSSLQLQFAGVSFADGTTTDAVSGDFDGDGDVDVVTIGDGTMRILLSSLNASSGTPSFTPGIANLGIGPGADLALTDADRDGDADVVQTFANTIGSIVWRNDGAGQIVQGGTLDPGNRWCAAGDVDDDGDADVVATGPGTGLRLFRTAGTGFNTGPTTLSPNGGLGVLLVDLDGDGDLEIVHPRGGASTAEVWQNDGAANFTLLLAGLPEGANTVAAADVDGDGDQDILVGVLFGIQVATNAGNGTFTMGAPYGGSEVRAITTGDVDGDGDVDAVVGGNAGFAVWTNSGGSLAEAPLTGAPASVLVLVDLDGDGDLDLLRGGEGSDQWWRNDAGTLVQVPVELSAGPTSDLVATDVDRDGDLDVLVSDASAAGGLRLFLHK